MIDHNDLIVYNYMQTETVQTNAPAFFWNSDAHSLNHITSRRRAIRACSLDKVSVAYSNVIVRLGLGLGLASGQVRYKVTNLVSAVSLKRKLALHKLVQLKREKYCCRCHGF